MRHLVTVMLLVILLAARPGFASGEGGSPSREQPVDSRPASSDGAGPQIIFLQDGRTIQAEESETLGDRIRIETPRGRIELPSSAVLSIHPMGSPAASPTTPPPVEVYRGVTQQMTDRVRGQIQEQLRPPTVFGPR